MKTTRSTIQKAQGNARRSLFGILLGCILALAMLFAGAGAGANVALADDGQEPQVAQGGSRTMLGAGALGAADDVGGASPVSGAEAPQPSRSDPHFTFREGTFGVACSAGGSVRFDEESHKIVLETAAAYRIYDYYHVDPAFKPSAEGFQGAVMMESETTLVVNTHVSKVRVPAASTTSIVFDSSYASADVGTLDVDDNGSGLPSFNCSGKGKVLSGVRCFDLNVSGDIEFASANVEGTMAIDNGGSRMTISKGQIAKLVTARDLILGDGSPGNSKSRLDVGELVIQNNAKIDVVPNTNPERGWFGKVTVDGTSYTGPWRYITTQVAGGEGGTVDARWNGMNVAPYRSGASVRVYAYPDADKKLTSLTYTGAATGTNPVDGSANPYEFYMPDEDVTVTAAFETYGYAINTQVTGGTGSVTIYKSLTSFTDDNKVTRAEAGDKLYALISPGTNEALASLAMNAPGISLPGPGQPIDTDVFTDEMFGFVYSFTMPNSDAKVVASFVSRTVPQPLTWEIIGYDGGRMYVYERSNAQFFNPYDYDEGSGTYIDLPQIDSATIGKQVGVMFDAQAGEPTVSPLPAGYELVGLYLNPESIPSSNHQITGDFSLRQNVSWGPKDASGNFIYGGDEYSFPMPVGGAHIVAVVAKKQDSSITPPAIPTHTVRFAAGEGTGTMPAQTATSGTPFVLPQSAFTPPEGKIFAAWEIGGKQYGPQEAPYITGDTTATAIYEDIGAEFTYSLSLADSIDINFYVKNIVDDPLSFEVAYGPGEEQTAEWKTEVPKTRESNCFVIASCAAKEMGDKVHVIVKHRGKVVKDGYYSVKSYCDAIIEASEGEHGKQLVDLCKATLDYGANAQKTFGYDTANLVNKEAGETGYFDNTGIAMPPYAATKSGSCEGITGVTLSLVTTAKTQLVVRFVSTAADGTAYSVAIDGGQPAECRVENGKAKVVVEGIAAKDLGAQREISVSDGQGGTYTFTVSPVDYMALAVSKDSQVDLNRAFYNYHRLAAAYQGSAVVLNRA
ncbi:MAG TPA: hypothetical protein DCP91_12285 [Eggerthellaceae bacterium]|nr:hypothetical protein [Eggerthellaceae bacterium]